jgi:hypothetical protein
MYTTRETPIEIELMPILSPTKIEMKKQNKKNKKNDNVGAICG